MALGLGVFALFRLADEQESPLLAWHRQQDLIGWTERFVAAAAEAPPGKVVTKSVEPQSEGDAWTVTGEIVVAGALRGRGFVAVIERLCAEMAARRCWRLSDLSLAAPLLESAAEKHLPPSKPAAAPARPPAQEQALAWKAVTPATTAADPDPMVLLAPAPPAEPPAASRGDAGLAALAEPPEPRVTAPATPAEPPTQRRSLRPFDPLVLEIQGRLRAMGYRTGPVDGLLGARSRAAIAAYQRQYGLEPDGEPTRELLGHISESSATAGPLSGSRPQPGSLAALRAGAGQPERVPERYAGLDDEGLILLIQDRLDKLGLGPIRKDGQLQSKTRLAIRTYQQRHGLQVTGLPSTGLLGHMERQLRAGAGLE